MDYELILKSSIPTQKYQSELISNHKDLNIQLRLLIKDTIFTF